MQVTKQLLQQRFQFLKGKEREKVLSALELGDPAILGKIDALVQAARTYFFCEKPKMHEPVSYAHVNIILANYLRRLPTDLVGKGGIGKMESLYKEGFSVLADMPCRRLEARLLVEDFRPLENITEVRNFLYEEWKRYMDSPNLDRAAHLVANHPILLSFPQVRSYYR